MTIRDVRSICLARLYAREQSLCLFVTCSRKISNLLIQKIAIPILLVQSARNSRLLISLYKQFGTKTLFKN